MCCIRSYARWEADEITESALNDGMSCFLDKTMLLDEF